MISHGTPKYPDTRDNEYSPPNSRVGIREVISPVSPQMSRSPLITEKSNNTMVPSAAPASPMLTLASRRTSEAVIDNYPSIDDDEFVDLWKFHYSPASGQLKASFFPKKFVGAYFTVYRKMYIPPETKFRIQQFLNAAEYKGVPYDPVRYKQYLRPFLNKLLENSKEEIMVRKDEPVNHRVALMIKNFKIPDGYKIYRKTEFQHRAMLDFGVRLVKRADNEKVPFPKRTFRRSYINLDEISASSSFSSAFPSPFPRSPSFSFAPPGSSPKAANGDRTFSPLRLSRDDSTKSVTPERVSTCILPPILAINNKQYLQDIVITAWGNRSFMNNAEPLDPYESNSSDEEDDSRTVTTYFYCCASDKCRKTPTVIPIVKFVPKFDGQVNLIPECSEVFAHLKEEHWNILLQAGYEFPNLTKNKRKHKKFSETV